jgi:hypothetical protein
MRPYLEKNPSQKKRAGGVAGGLQIPVPQKKKKKKSALWHFNVTWFQAPLFTQETPKNFSPSAGVMAQV